MAGKYRGAAYQICKLTKKIPVIFHNLRVYGSHLIIKEIGKFDVKVNVIANGLEKYMAFTINTNLVFIDSMQFMNCSLDSLIKNLSDDDFKNLSKEFSDDLDSFKKFSESKLPDGSKLFSSLKDKCISEKDYFKAADIWNVFKMTAMGNYHNLF